MSSWSTRPDAFPGAARLLVERAHEELLAGNAADPRLAAALLGRIVLARKSG
jgi:hypothetical protein